MGLAAHRDDPARGRSKNPVEQQSRQRERPEEIRAEVTLEAVGGQLPRLVHDPGVVDQDVDDGIAGPQFVGAVAHRRQLADIQAHHVDIGAGNRPQNVLAGRGGRVGVAAGEHHGGTQPCKSARGFEPYPGVRPRHDGGPATLRWGLRQGPVRCGHGPNYRRDTRLGRVWSDSMHADVALTDLDRFTNGFPHHVFAVLRRESPVWFHPPTAHSPGGEGFWVLSRYADIVAAATDDQAFSSETGGGRDGGGTTLEDMPLRFAVGSLLNMMDDPRHAKFRKLLMPSMTPRALHGIEQDLRRRAVAIVDAALAKRDCDFLVDVAAELPLQAVAELVGVPQQDRHELMGWANVTLDYEDREVGEVNEKMMQAQARMFAYGAELLEHKRAQPADDLLSVVTHA